MDRYTAVTGSRTRIAPVVFGDPTVQDICVIVPGEIKALALWSLLMERNIPWAVATSAGGENFWDEHWPSMLNFVSVAIWPDRDAKGMAFVSLIHDAHLSRAIPVVPDDHTDTKGIDDYILAGGDPRSGNRTRIETEKVGNLMAQSVELAISGTINVGIAATIIVGHR